MSQPSSSKLVHINPKGLHDPTPSCYTHVVTAPLAGRTIFASGQCGDIHHNGQPLDFAAQLDGALAGMKTVIQAGGGTVHDIVRINLYIVNHTEALLPIWSAAAKRIWGEGPYPASTLVPVPRLALDGLLVEIEATAVVLE
jgi:enamine deaminase RidA (YjgF/YER057c/UK114 family)